MNGLTSASTCYLGSHIIWKWSGLGPLNNMANLLTWQARKILRELTWRERESKSVNTDRQYQKAQSTLKLKRYQSP